jgi:hypothetical protein
MRPISLSDSQLFQLKTTASAIDPALRSAFLQKIAAHMKKMRGYESGDGTFFRLCQAVADELRGTRPMESEHAPLPLGE